MSRSIVTFKNREGQLKASGIFPASASVKDMKLHLEKVCSIPVAEQMLRIGLRFLDEEETLGTIGSSTCFILERIEHKLHTPGTAQLYVTAHDGAHKLECFAKLLDACSAAQWVVYCNDRTEVTRLVDQLREQKVSVSAHHGHMHQDELDRVLRRHHVGDLKVLVLTDAVPPRFLENMEPPPIIINYDFPPLLEDYGRRVFRTGSFEAKAVAISFVLPEEMSLLRDVRSFFCTEVHELALPEQLAADATQVAQSVPDGHAKRFHRTEICEHPHGC